MYLPLMLGSDFFLGVMVRLTYVLGVDVDRTIKPGTTVSECLLCTSGRVKLQGNLNILIDLSRDLMTFRLPSNFTLSRCDI